MKIGIRREDKSRWERRVPLVPEDVKKLKQCGFEIFVQPSSIRIYTEDEFVKAGATIQENLDVPLIVCIKEIPIECLRPNKTYLFFSHTIKGQAKNMPMLKKIMELQDTLIDYEKIASNGQRLIAFGKFAGIAGMIDALWALGKRWQHQGICNPFSSIRRAYEYSSLEEFKEQCKAISQEIKNKGFAKEVCPVVIGISGYGNVSKGTQELLEFLPVQEISPENLSKIQGQHQIYKVVFQEKDMMSKKNQESFDLKDYYQHPENYVSFFDKYLDFFTIFVNAIYWDEKYPRLLTQNWVEKNYTEQHKLKVIADMSCDVHGAVEINEKSTLPDDPIYQYNPITKKISMGYQEQGPVVLAVDILPSELPKESSIYFSEKLSQLIPEIAHAQYPSDFELCTLPPHLKNAVIVYKGKLTPNFLYLEKYL